MRHGIKRLKWFAVVVAVVSLHACFGSTTHTSKPSVAVVVGTTTHRPLSLSEFPIPDGYVGKSVTTDREILVFPDTDYANNELGICDYSTDNPRIATVIKGYLAPGEAHAVFSVSAGSHVTLYDAASRPAAHVLISTDDGYVGSTCTVNKASDEFKDWGNINALLKKT